MAVSVATGEGRAERWGIKTQTVSQTRLRNSELPANNHHELTPDHDAEAEGLVSGIWHQNFPGSHAERESPLGSVRPGCVGWAHHQRESRKWAHASDARRVPSRAHNQIQIHPIASGKRRGCERPGWPRTHGLESGMRTWTLGYGEAPGEIQRWSRAHRHMGKQCPNVRHMWRTQSNLGVPSPGIQEAWFATGPHKSRRPLGHPSCWLLRAHPVCSNPQRERKEDSESDKQHRRTHWRPAVAQSPPEAGSGEVLQTNPKQAWGNLPGLVSETAARQRQQWPADPLQTSRRQPKPQQIPRRSGSAVRFQTDSKLSAERGRKRRARDGRRRTALGENKVV